MLISTHKGDDLAFGIKYYLNPTSNDRNVEYDTKNNLAIPANASGKERDQSKYWVNKP
jgi:hypothetical protein